VPQPVRGNAGLLKRIEDALNRALSQSASRLISWLVARSRERRAPPQAPDSGESATVREPGAPRPDLDALSILKEAPEDPAYAEELAADANSLLHRLAAGGRLSAVGTTLCQRLIQEKCGYQPDSVLEVAVGEGRFSPEDLAEIAAFLVSVYYEPGADTCANESMARRVFEALAERSVVTHDLVKLCVRAMADAPCVSLTRPVQQYLKKTGGMAGEYRATVVAAFNQDSYSAYCRRQPAAEEKPLPPATWDKWEGRDAWSHAGGDWPLACLFLELDTGREIDILLEREPPAGVPAQHTLHYFLLRGSWLNRRESPGSLRSLGRLLRSTAAKPQWKPLHDRAVLVFRDHWNRGQFGPLTAMAAQVYQGLLALQPKVDPGNAPDRLPGMSRLHLAELQRPRPEEPQAAAPPESLMLPSQVALRRRFERLRADVKERPDNSGAWHEMAGIYRELSLWNKAIVAEDLAIQYHLNFAVAYYGRGKARMEIHDWADAAADFSAAIRIWEFPGGLEKFLTLEEPSDEYVDSYRTRGVASAHQDDHDAAIGDVSTAIRLRSHNARLYYELAHLEERAGRTQDAGIDAYNAGLLYLDRGEKEDAAECVSLLDRLGAHDRADNLRIRMAARKPSDLP
jgi:tetratricopeptide (TPR) repeat protein